MTDDETLTLRLTVIGGQRCADDYQVIWRGMSIGHIMRASGTTFEGDLRGSPSVIWPCAIWLRLVPSQPPPIARLKPPGVASVVPGTSSTAICSGLPVHRGRAHPLSHGHQVTRGDLRGIGPGSGRAGD